MTPQSTEAPAVTVEFMCPPPPREELPLTAILAVGFGSVSVFRDEEGVWSGDDEGMTLAHFEDQAKAAPEHDWRVEFIGPLSGATYQRNADGRWLLIERNEGFA